MVSRVGGYVDGENLVVPIQNELDGDAFTRIQGQIFETISQNRLTGVVIDLSGISVLDTYLAAKVFDTEKMTALMGVNLVITGINSGMAMSLIDLGFDPGTTKTAVTLEDGLFYLRKMASPKAHPNTQEEASINDMAICEDATGDGE